MPDELQWLIREWFISHALWLVVLVCDEVPQTRAGWCLSLIPRTKGDVPLQAARADEPLSSLWLVMLSGL